MTQKILNALLFQIGWFACVLGGAEGNYWLGPLTVLIALALQLPFYENPKKELHFLLLATLTGSTLDALSVFAGLFSFPAIPLWWPLPYPPSMIALWVLFAFNFHSSMSWLSGHYRLATLFGVVGGPLSYYAGYRLNAVLFSENIPLTLLAISITWGVLMPLTLWLSHKIR